jgi:N-acetyl-1-D-myo-inositol-2-amino-2-deoxy-alpha-D-glucopyranoside deacetylase
VRLLATVAHPDDEAFGLGSLLAHASARGVESVVACATRGELGEPAPGSGLPPDVAPADLGRVREAELRAACRLLGVRRVDVLDWLDSGMDGDPAPGSLAAADPDVVAGQVADLIDDVRPDVVVTIGLHDIHRDHIAIGQATLAAVERATHRAERAYVWCLERDLLRRFVGDRTLDVGVPRDEVTTVVDVSAHLDDRSRAIRAHSSQVPPFDAMPSDLADAFLRTDWLVRVRPPWPGGAVEADWLPPNGGAA